jgi:hypothetical protein
VTAPPSIVAATPVVTPTPVAEAAQPAYQTANSNTTLVSLSSTPSGAEIRDADDRMLGLTPFDFRVPSSRPLQLTLRHEGYKPVKVQKKVDGEHVAVSVSMKKDKSSDTELNKRSVGYKDDPY